MDALPLSRRELPPFPYAEQLNCDLWPATFAHPDPHVFRLPWSVGDESTPASSVAGCLNCKSILTVPGRPLVPLSNARAVSTLLHQELSTEELDALDSILWLVSTPDWCNIYSLHQQVVHDRQIVITEDSRLHLVWYFDRIFVKPLPAYLLNHTFWATYLAGDDEYIRRSALGFVRSYTQLIQSASDFRLAEEKHLLPAGVDFEPLLHFLECFRESSEKVTPRYRYGQLRLVRLNRWSRLCKRKMFYHRLHGQHSAYFARFLPPFLFVFAIISVGLAAFQILVGIKWARAGALQEVMETARWFAVTCLLLIAITSAFFPVLQAAFLVDEFVFALRKMWGREESHE